MKNTILQNCSTETNSFNCYDEATGTSFPLTLIPGQSVVIGSSVNVQDHTGLDLGPGGVSYAWYYSGSGYTYAYGSASQDYDVFYDGLGFGAALAGAIFAFWMVRLMNRAVVEN